MIQTSDSKYNILWLSDIHYTIFDKENKLITINHFLQSFLKTCKQIKQNLLKNQQQIDFIIITGDIAQSGAIEEYEHFKKDILFPLFKIFEEAELLIIPGNHDVSRDKIEYFEKYFKKNQHKKNNLEFVKNNPQIEKVFENYTLAFKDFKFIPEHTSKQYKEKLYHGFYHCNTKDTIFTLLNSSWLSFGEESLKYYFDNKRNDKKSSIEKVKDISNRANEYGNQVIGLNLFSEIDLLKKYISSYNDHIVITAIHHPINWLTWSERIDYNGNEDGFFYLKNKTDVLLCGHEHVPKHYYGEYYNDSKSLILSSGAFIEVNNEINIEQNKNITYPDFQNSTFIILFVNSTKRNLSQKKYYFDIREKKWINNENEDKMYKLNKNYSSKLNPEIYNQIFQKISDNNDFSTILTKLYNKKVIKQEEHYITKNEIIILIKRKEDWNSDSLKSILLKNHSTFQKARFICFDFLFDENKKYQNTEDKLLVLNEIKKGIEFDFNNFRYHFFSKLNEKDAKKFVEITFICDTIPFWRNKFNLTL